MKQMTLEDIHFVELSLLDHFASYCEKSNLRYYLAYGTLLGVVRHGGFIPWDDDADVLMPREDYDRFVAEYEDNDKFFMVKPFQKEYGFAWAKLVDRRTAYKNNKYVLPESYGLSLDVFPLDSDSGPFWFYLSQRMRHLRKIKWGVDNPSDKTAPIKKTAKRLLKAIIPQYFIDERGFDFVRGRNASANLCINYTSPYAYKRESKPNEWFGEGRVVAFEGTHMFRIPDEPEKILAATYGENWRIPVVSPHKLVTVYWR